MMPKILAAVFAIFFYVSLSLAVANESNTQMFVIVNKLYEDFGNVMQLRLIHTKNTITN